MTEKEKPKDVGLKIWLIFVTVVTAICSIISILSAVWFALISGESHIILLSVGIFISVLGLLFLSFRGWKYYRADDRRWAVKLSIGGFIASMLLFGILFFLLSSFAGFYA